METPNVSEVEIMRSSAIHLFLALLIFSGRAHSQPTSQPAPASTPPGESKSDSGSHFDRARELYALGPSKAAEILAELELELRDHPENVQAFLLKATTQMGTGQFDASLATLDELAELASKTEAIYPSAIFLRARCLFYKGDYESAKRTLEPFWAFFQDDDESKAQYDGLMAAITAEMQNSKKE